MNYSHSDDDWHGPSERKQRAIQEILTVLSGRAPLDVVIQSYLGSVEGYSAEIVETACSRLRDTATERPYPARLRNRCSQIRAESEDDARRGRMPEPPPGERWLTPDECRERFEALQAHPVPERRLHAVVHRIVLNAYYRGANRE